MADIIHWITSPLSTATQVTLLLRSQGVLRRQDRRFETAFLIAIGCLDSDLKVTEKGRDALQFYFEGSPLIEHLISPKMAEYSK